MTRNDLYDVAFRYKKAGLWKKLWDNDVFAVKLKSMISSCVAEGK